MLSITYMMRTLKTLLLAVGLCAVASSVSRAQVSISITAAPPELITYEQPPCPVDGYLWTPGYWAYGEEDYYWVPGVWVAPPRVGFLWTPGYWGFHNGFYAFNDGYWGPRVGFYGGVNYGFGYGGNGYYGGGWQGDHFRYNTAVTRVNTTVIHNTYVDKTVINRGVTNSRASFNGPGGVSARETAEQRQFAQQNSANRPTEAQLSPRQQAIHDPGASAAQRLNRPPAGRANPQTAQANQPGRQEAAPSQPQTKAERQAARHQQAAGGPKFPGGQGGTSQASRDAALANERHQNQGPEQRDAERQQARQQARQAQPRQPQAQQVHPQRGIVGRAPQQAHAQKAPRQQKEGGGGHQGKKEEKH